MFMELMSLFADIAAIIEIIVLLIQHWSVRRLRTRVRDPKGRGDV
jgi:hypothetical protein